MLGWYCYDSYMLVLKETAIGMDILSLVSAMLGVDFFKIFFCCCSLSSGKVCLYIYFPECFCLCVFIFLCMW